MKFRIHLKELHNKSGHTFYRVAKDTGLSHNTVRKYAEEDVESDLLPASVIVLAKYYGADWRSDEVVEIIGEE